MSNNKKIALFCAREDGQAGVIIDTINEFRHYELIGVFDNNEEYIGIT